MWPKTACCAACAAGAIDALDWWQKSHVQHSVCLVKDQFLYTGKVCVAAFYVVRAACRDRPL